MELLRTLLDALKLVFVRIPRRPARRIGPGQFWAVLALVAAALALESWLLVEAPRAFAWFALHGVGFVGALSLLVAYLAAVALRRPGILWSLATLVLASQLWIEVLLWPVELELLPRTALTDAAQGEIARNLWIVLTLVSLRRAFDYLEPYRGTVTRTVAALGVGAALIVPLLLFAPLPMFQPGQRVEPEEGYAEARREEPDYDPERVMARQDRLVDAAVAALAPQVPGRVDLYVVAFGGDGGERVFRNEVEYVERLYATRFGAAGRVVSLINSPDTVESRPLASRRNLRRALRGVGQRVDPAEDIVLLFMTSHGSEDHELYVALEPLPLAQLQPGDVQLALDDAGIEWRIVVVSACYSGGFIPALAGPRSLVISAARSDRTSFGCGVESDFTYFGHAFFVEALNETPSPLEAFERAGALIAKRERAEDVKRSYPQISRAPELEQRLARWLAELTPGPVVPFVPPPRQDEKTATAARTD